MLRNVTQCYVLWAGKCLINKQCCIIAFLGELRGSACECVGKVTLVLCNEIFYK